MNKFEQEYSMKPVQVKGIMDFDKEFKVLKYKNGEKGVEVVTPFYTHLDSNEKACALLVNRGWLPWDLKDYRFDRRVDVTKVKGVLYRGDNKFEGANHNSPALNDWVNVYPEEMAVVGQIPNKEAHQFMLKAIDLDESIPTAMPDVPSKSSL